MRILVSIIFMLLSMAGISQVYQRQSSPFEFVRGIKQDTIAVIPRGCDTVALPRMKFGAPTIGALYYDTCANTLYVKDTWGWVAVTGGLDSAAFAPVIDSTGQRFYRVLFAVNNKISGSDKFTYDSLLNYLLITGKAEADSLIISQNAQFGGITYIDDLEAYNLRVTNTSTVYDTTNYKLAVLNTTTGRVEMFGYWPTNGGTSGSYVDTIYRKPGTDSIFYTINNGAERAIKDSIGGGGSGDYVPYENATRKVRLTDYGLLTDFVDFDMTPTNADTTGRLNWDSTAGTLAVHLRGNNVHLQIGQEQVILVRNNTGSPLTDGQIVYITGSTGEVPTVALANNKTFTIASRTLGMVTEPIAHGEQGFITITGIVNGLNTNAFTEGAAIWLDSLNGAYTQVQPVSPYNDVLLGYVVKKAGGNGSIFVKAQNILDRNYIDSVVGLRLRIADTTAMLLPYLRKADTVGMRAKEVLSFAKNAARDSAILTLFDGTRLAVRDSIGGGGLTIDSVAIRRYGSNANNIRSFNAGGLTAAAQLIGSSSLSNDSTNLLLGEIAGRDLTTGYMNQFIGARVGLTATTAHSNTMLGFQAYGTAGVKTGSHNVGIGRDVLRAATSSSNNVGVGVSALAAVTTGGGNVAIGRSALANLTTGTNNVAIGGGTIGDDMTTGSENVFIGESSANNMSLAHTGSTFIGNSSGGGATGAAVNGDYSIGIGHSAGQRLTGYQNITIGRRSGGVAGAGNISGNNNILFGAGAVPPANASSDQITFWVGASSSGTTGYNALTRFTGGGWLINYTTSAVTAQTASAALEINGTTGAVLFPRMTTAQRDALTAADGMVIYNTSTNKLQVRAAAAWVDLH